MLVSLADMKSYLGIDSSDTTYDAFLTLQLEIVSESIEGYCGRSFEKRTWNQTLYKQDWVNQDKIYLYHYPLTQQVTSITKDDGTPMDLDEVVNLNPVAMLRRLGDDGKFLNFFFFDCDSIEVEYEAGYATIPAPIRSVVYSLVSETYSKKKVGIDVNFGNDVQRLSIPGVISIDFDYTLQSNERKNKYGMILGNYLNVLDSYRSERSIGLGSLEYVEEVVVGP